MIPREIFKLYELLTSFLGESKNELDETYQLQFPCPRCVENKGNKEHNKFNLEINLRKGVYQCWSCAQHDDEMHGSIKKLIKLYGNSEILHEYKETITSLRTNELYKIHFDESDFEIDIASVDNTLLLPKTFTKLIKKDKYQKDEYLALSYLNKRGIQWDIINKFEIGYTKFDNHKKNLSDRIVIPSYDYYGELNYWTGRDITNLKFKQKYFNPEAERKNIIFNEEKIEWDADITLVEGPFDHIVVPNSIPLLGKVLKTDFHLYDQIMSKANANVNIFLDGDAFNDVKSLYKLLNHGRLYDRIRFIPVEEELDPSKIYELYGKKGIAKCLSLARKIDEVFIY